MCVCVCVCVCIFIGHENIRFNMEKEFDRTLAFLDVCINNEDPSCLIPQSIIKRPLLDYPPIFSASLRFLANLALSVH